MASLIKSAAFTRPMAQLRRLAMPKQRSVMTRSTVNQQVNVEQQGQNGSQQAMQRQGQGQPARRQRGRSSLSQRFGPESSELAPMIAPWVPSRVPSLLRALDSELGLGNLTRLFDFPEFDNMDRTSSSVAPLPGVGLGAVDIQETPNAYIFKVDVPGLSKEDVKVRVTRDGVLVIEGERKQEEEKEEAGFKRYERVFGQFVRRFRLPDNVEASKIKAKTENGVLHIEVPKTEEHDKPHHDVQIE